MRKHVAATAIPEGEDAERTAQQLPRSSERGYPERIVFSGPDLRDARFLYAQPDVYDALVARVVAVVRERPREHRPRGRARARAPDGSDPPDDDDLYALTRKGVGA